MTILLDFSLIAPGGSATYATAFLSALSSRQDLADTVLLVPHHIPDLDGVLDELVRVGARVQRTHLGSGWRSAMLRQVVVPYYSLRFRARAVYCPREAAPLLTPARLVVLTGNLKVWSPAGSTTISARALWAGRSVVSRLAVRRSARVLAVSAVMAEALPVKVGKSAVVIHHGCDLEHVERSHLDGSVPDEPLRLVALGTISKHKRFDLLIDAVAALQKQGQPAHLDIWGPVGDQACAEALRRQGRRLLGADPLRGPASRQRSQEILEHADVLAMSSSFESFGMPLLEGMRTSCLVWAPASALIDELCGPVAVSYPEAAPEAAARELIAALPTAPARLSRGRDRCRAFTWASTVERTLRVVREAAS